MAKTEHREAAAPAPQGEVTRLPLVWSDASALERLIRVVDGEPHATAERYLHREPSGSST